MNQKDTNLMMMDAIEVAKAHFKFGRHLRDLSGKQRRAIGRQMPDRDMYLKLSRMNLGATSSASRIMLLDIDGRIN
tara:strand:+ start:182 stop:409 length:228 start_codon:yes stop_codon:yes gene_type:complete